MLLKVLSNPLNDTENPLSQGLCPLNISTVVYSLYSCSLRLLSLWYRELLRMYQKPEIKSSGKEDSSASFIQSWNQRQERRLFRGNTKEKRTSLMYGLLQGQKKAHDTNIKLNRVLPKDTIRGVRGG